MPNDYGVINARHIQFLNYVNFLLFSYDFKWSITSIILSQTYIFILAQVVFYDEDFNFKMVRTSAWIAIWMLYNCAIIHMIISWIGSMFVEAEMPRASNEKLLHNLKEAVFIIDFDTGQVVFQNNAAKRVIERLFNLDQMSLVNESREFNLKNELFRKLDLKEFKQD